MPNTAPQLQTKPASIHPLLRSQPRNRQEVQQAAEQAANRSPACPAEKSIAAMKGMFTSEYTRNRIRLAYASLSEKQRRMVVFCSGLKREHCDMAFDSFTDEEALAIGRGVKEINTIVKRFENSIGPLSRLNPSSFS